MTDKDKLLDFLNSAGIPYAVAHIDREYSIVIGDVYRVSSMFTKVIPINSLDDELTTGYPHFYHEFIFNDNGKIRSSRTWE